MRKIPPGILVFAFCLAALGQTGDESLVVTSQEGDTIRIIAKRYNVDPVQTLHLNLLQPQKPPVAYVNIELDSKLPVGFKVLIPKKNLNDGNKKDPDFSPSPLDELSKLELESENKTQKYQYLPYIRSGSEWLHIGSSTTGDQYSYRTGTRRKTQYGNTIEAWVRRKPSPTITKVRGKTIVRDNGYVLLYIAADCDDKRFSIESVESYDARGKLKWQDRFGSAFREPIFPGSIRELIWDYFCN